jgi:hypothetical protein
MTRTYSDRQRAESFAILDVNGGNVRRASRDSGVPRSALTEWAGGAVNADMPALREEQRRELAGRFEAIAEKLVDAMPGKISTANLQQVATALGICVDKMRLPREQPSQIEVMPLTDGERIERLAALSERAQHAQRNGSGGSPTP